MADNPILHHITYTFEKFVNKMDVTMADSNGPDAHAQVKVIFTTTEADLQLPESKSQLLVPAGMRLPSKV
jgi:hypothetical protein